MVERNGFLIAVLGLSADFVLVHGDHRRLCGGEERVDENEQQLYQKLTTYGVVQGNALLIVVQPFVA